MPTNLNTVEKQQREVAAQARLRSGFELSTFRQMLAELNDTYSVAADAVVNGYGMDSLGIAMNGRQARMTALLSTVYQDVSKPFGQRTLRSVAPKLAESGENLSNFEAAIRRYISEYSPLKAMEINDTTMNDINESLVESFDEGLTLDETALKIEKDAGTINRTRSAKIARTEVHSASNAANLASLDGINTPIIKFWIAANGDRTRATHATANGQEQHKDGTFIVGSASLRYPGDPDGPASEVVNCRCVMGYKTET